MPPPWIVAAGVAAVAALLALSGRALQAWGARRDRRRFPPPGRMVAVNGHRLHCVSLDRREASAAPAPTVIFEAALGGSSLSWLLVQGTVARYAPTLAYDRAGLGYSEAGPMPRTLAQGAAELHALLANAGAQPPYVLVGHSYGGLLVQLYAAQHPEQVCGLVLVDAPAARQWARPSEHDRQRLLTGAALARRGAWAARWGLARLAAGLVSVGAFSLARGTARLVSGGTLGRGAESIFAPAMALPAEVRPAMRACWLLPKFYEALGSHMESLSADARRLEAHPLPPGLGLCVLTASGPSPERWQEQQELAEQCPGGLHWVAQTSGHWIPLEEPDLVVAAVLTVLRTCKINR